MELAASTRDCSELFSFQRPQRQVILAAQYPLRAWPRTMRTPNPLESECSSRSLRKRLRRYATGARWKRAVPENSRRPLRCRVMTGPQPNRADRLIGLALYNRRGKRYFHLEFGGSVPKGPICVAWSMRPEKVLRTDPQSMCRSRRSRRTRTKRSENWSPSKRQENDINTQMASIAGEELTQKTELLSRSEPRTFIREAPR